MDAAFGQRALGGFELQLEPEWVEGCRSGRQLAFRFARQDAACQQSPIWRLGGVIAAVFARPPLPALRARANPAPGGYIRQRPLFFSLPGSQDPPLPPVGA